VSHRIVYCLTRDHELARALDERLDEAIAFFYNDAARLHQAVRLRTPDLVLVDAGAIRAEYGDAGLGPVVTFLRERAPRAQVTVRPAGETMHHLVLVEAGPDVLLAPVEVTACVETVATACRDA
jgi:hypothetical protein